MVEYLAEVIGLLGIMFFLLETSFRMGEPVSLSEEPFFNMIDAIKTSLLLLVFAFGLILIWLLITIAQEQTASAALQQPLYVTMYLWLAGSVLLFGGLTLYWMWWLPKYAKKGYDKASKNEGL